MLLIHSRNATKPVTLNNASDYWVNGHYRMDYIGWTNRLTDYWTNRLGLGV